MQMTGIADIIQCAVNYHCAGRLERAQEFYEKVPKDQPENPDVLHLLGTLFYQTGRYDVAVELISRAIAGEPGIALFHNTLGVVLQALGKSQESLDAYHHAISLRPDLAEPYSNMASVLQSLSRRKLSKNTSRQFSLRPTVLRFVTIWPVHFNLKDAGK